MILRAYLGLDLGLSGARAAVTGADGKLLGVGRQNYDTRNVGGEADPDVWLEAGCRAAREAVSAAGSAKTEAVGIGALGPCAITLDESLRPTGPASVFAFDTRQQNWHRKLMDAGLSPDVVGIDHSLPKMLRLRDVDPDRFARSRWVVDATGYAVARFTGMPVIDPISVLDHTAEGHDPPCPVPPVRPAESVAGSVTREAAEWLGVREGTPVAVGSYDSYVDLFGAGVRDRGDAGILLGSTLVISAVTDANKAPRELRLTPHIGPGQALGGWTSAAGSLIAWASRVIGPTEPGDPAEGLPGDSGLLMLPYFAGERAPVWDGDARGALIGLTLASSAADIRRAAIEAVALSAMDITRRLDEAAAPIRRYRVAGGGALIPGLSQAMADATGATLEIVEHPGEALGGAILAGRAVGVDVPRGVARTFEPNPRAAARYAELLDIYRPLYGQLRDAMHRLGRLAAEGERA